VFIRVLGYILWMKLDLKNLPSDSNELHQIITDLVMTNTNLASENERLQEPNSRTRAAY